MGADKPPAIRGIRVLVYASATAFLETGITSNPACVVNRAVTGK